VKSLISVVVVVAAVSDCISVCQVEAVDIDEGLNGRVEYRLYSGNNHGHFAVNPRLGTLRVASELDREQVAINSLPSFK